MESSMEVPQKLKIDLLHDPMIPLLGIYPNVCKPEYNRTTCTSMFTAALFTIALLWKQPSDPKTNEQI
jgi:hypothetical protein